MGRGSAGNVSLLLCVLVFLAAEVRGVAAADGGHVASAAKGGVYRRPLRQDPGTLDPARISDIYGRSVSQQLFDGLVQFDHTLTVVPSLAQFWKASRDGLTWTFTLRKGVRFHHGRELTSDDVVFSLTRLVDPRVKSVAADLFATIRGAREFREGRARQVDGLTALDRYTVQVTLTESFAPFVSQLAIGHAKIVPRDAVERDPEGFGARPVGTGPFRFVRWERAKEIVLDANPDYFDGPPRLARVVYRILAGEAWDTAYDQFVAGTLEDTPVSARDYARVIRNPDHLYVKRPNFTVRFYGLHIKTGPLADRRVRQALIHAIDREGIVNDAHLGRYLPARGILPPGTPGFNPRLTGYAYDPARARDLLAQAGFPGGKGLPPLQIWAAAKDVALLKEHELMKRMLEAVGLRVDYHYLTDWPAFSKMLTEGKLPVFQYAWYADVPDPDNFLFKLFHSQSARNFFGYHNPVVDDLLMRARGEADMLRRVELYRRAEQMILDDAPVIPVWHYTYERLFQKYVRSVEVSGLGDPYIPLRKIWLDRAP
jgi:peptide/nickel transport system substrate-binding protein/oligopeptide transport system substrate-binding protein